MHKAVVVFLLSVVVFLFSSCYCCDKQALPKGTDLASLDRKALEDANPYFAYAFAFLDTVDLFSIAQGKYPLCGDTVFAVVMTARLKESSQATMEVHDKYIDIQMPITGSEAFGLRLRRECSRLKDSVTNDFGTYLDPPSVIETLQPGQLIILPTDIAHAPLIGEGEIKKLVIKVFQK